MRTHAFTCMHTHPCINTHAFTRVHTHAFTCMHMHAHACIHMNTHACIHIHSHAYTCIHSFRIEPTPIAHITQCVLRQSPTGQQKKEPGRERSKSIKIRLTKATTKLFHRKPVTKTECEADIITNEYANENEEGKDLDRNGKVNHFDVKIHFLPYDLFSFWFIYVFDLYAAMIIVQMLLHVTKASFKELIFI